MTPFLASFLVLLVGAAAEGGTAPRVNQLGYPDGTELSFSLSQGPGVQAGATVELLDEMGQLQSQGRLPDPALDDRPSSGELVFRVELAAPSKEGRYRIRVGQEVSPAFQVGKNIYAPLFQDALRCFSLIRCGMAVNDEKTGIHHARCHDQDAPVRGEGSNVLDLRGGWHNAGDFGKWTHMAAISAAWMLWLHELTGMDGGLLTEARWGLDWLLRMQRPDGGVLHKVDTEPDFAWGKTPDQDPLTRRATRGGAWDAADFCGVLAQAARVFSVKDPAYSARCKAAAFKAWSWLEAHPNQTTKDPYYGDDGSWQEKLWALGEMARLSVDPALAQRFRQEAGPGKLQPLSWESPQFFGYLAQVTALETPAEDKERIRKDLVDLTQPWIQASKESAYGVLLTSKEYYWGSNENLLHKTGMLLCISQLTGDREARTCALKQMNYLLGQNSLGLSFITGYGENSVINPYHWSMASQKVLMPGWASGGPNSQTAGADPLLLRVIQAGTAPARCFVDAWDGGSWASNEGETTENAALVFCAGFLSSGS